MHGFIFVWYTFSVYVSAIRLVQAQQSCNDACVLPACRCFSDRSIPGYLSPFLTPQTVLLTFVGGLNSALEPLYDVLLNFQNPNNCPIRTTFFIDDTETDYSVVASYANRGHEIGVQSLNGTSPTSANGWTDMIRDMDRRLDAIGLPPGSIKGVRAPQLSFGGTDELTGMETNGMLYDSSCLTSTLVTPGTLKWPFTYDHEYGMFKCDNGQAVERAFPGRWQFMLASYNFEGSRCAIPDACGNVKTGRQAFDILHEAFLDHYLGDRAPYTIVISPAWIKTDYKRDGLIDFLTYITNYKDVWVVTQTQSLQWVQHPTSIQNITQFEPWKC